jgi:hypothetical protein
MFLRAGLPGRDGRGHLDLDQEPGPLCAAASSRVWKLYRASRGHHDWKAAVSVRSDTSVTAWSSTALIRV